MIKPPTEEIVLIQQPQTERELAFYSIQQITNILYKKKNTNMHVQWGMSIIILQAQTFTSIERTHL